MPQKRLSKTQTELWGMASRIPHPLIHSLNFFNQIAIEYLRGIKEQAEAGATKAMMTIPATKEIMIHLFQRQVNNMLTQNRLYGIIHFLHIFYLQKS